MMADVPVVAQANKEVAPPFFVPGQDGPNKKKGRLTKKGGAGYERRGDSGAMLTCGVYWNQGQKQKKKVI